MLSLSTNHQHCLSSNRCFASYAHPVTSFEFQSCNCTPHVEFLTGSRIKTTIEADCLFIVARKVKESKSFQNISTEPRKEPLAVRH